MSNVIENFYDQHPEFGVNSTRRRKIEELIETEIDNNGGKRILDIGCASGYLTSKYSNNNQVIGIDISERSVRKAREVLNEAHRVNLEEYPWPDEVIKRKYDIIICGELIEHLFAPENLIKYLKDLLGEKGAIILSTPNFLYWTDRIKMLLGYYEITDKGHIRLFSYKSILKMLDGLGFEIIKENHTIDDRIPERIGNVFPALFAHQFVVKIKPIK